MSNNGFSKGWFLTILFLVIAQAAFVRIISSEKPPRIESLPRVELDPQGRAITFVGDIQLHVPEHLWGSRPLHKIERDYLPLPLCWQEDTINTTPGCPSSAGIRTFVLPVAGAVDFPLTDGIEVLERRTRTYVGPIGGEIEGVNIYRHPTGGFAHAYALTAIDPSGRYPFASCNSLYCTVRFRVHPQVSVQYDFGRPLIGDWPQIHAGVREAVESMIPGQ